MPKNRPRGTDLWGITVRTPRVWGIPQKSPFSHGVKDFNVDVRR